MPGGNCGTIRHVSVPTRGSSWVWDLTGEEWGPVSPLALAVTGSFGEG